MNFLDNIDDEFKPKPSDRTEQETTVLDEDGMRPRQAFSKVREKLMELEIERDEQAKNLELVKQLRQKERHELS